MVEQQDLIFDIGMHKGHDTYFYLGKGFRVVGVEAVPALCEIASLACAQYLKDGRLHIVQKALARQSNEMIPFYVTAEKDDWGSADRLNAEKGLYTASEITVPTITLNEILADFGSPYYVKCDIEGGDAIFVEQLAATDVRPSFVSIELTSTLDLSRLASLGYRQFQLVNQWINPHRQPPIPAREGRYVHVNFFGEMSGLFGRELPEDKWSDLDTVMKLYLDWRSLRERDPDLGVGWLDVHARRG